MLKLLLGSHGHFASGMKTSIDILAGGCDRLTVIDAYVDDSIIDKDLEDYFATVKEDDQVIMMSDLLGGSVNSKMYLYLQRPNTFLVAGVNLALVLELTMHESITAEELNNLVDLSKTMYQVVTLSESDDIPQEEDFF